MQKDKFPLTYADAGVDIDAGNKAVSLIRNAVKSTFRSEVLTDIGGFGGLFSLDISRYTQPVLVSGTDGVGTKLKVAIMMGKHNTIGIDTVAMCANDILVQGAEPLFFLDYLATGKLVPEKVASIVSGVADGCRQAGCALIGGETAEMPGFYGEGEYDIAGFIVGVVNKPDIISGETIEPGDVLLGLPSSGLHSNGYSLARKALLERAGYKLDTYIDALGRTVGEELLEPTRIYVKTIHKLLKQFHIKGLAHITGGGLVENIPRMMPPGLGARLKRDSWPVHPVFELIKEIAGIDNYEMLRTFNMGIGMVMAVPPDQQNAIMEYLAENNEPVYNIGTVGKESGVFFIE
jgi:phosphoribosylformylglycinamidine cyclo-ligase